MAEAAHFLVIVAGKHVGEMRDAETHFRPERSRQQFARDFRRIDRRRRLEAIVAIAALLRRILPEVAEEDRAATAGGFDEGGHRVEPLALIRAPRGLYLGLDTLARAGEIFCAPEQPGLGGIAVTPGAAGLLVISFDRLRDAGMSDETDVRLVDAHAEGDRRRDHHVLGLHESRLVART